MPLQGGGCRRGMYFFPTKLRSLIHPQTIFCPKNPQIVDKSTNLATQCSSTLNSTGQKSVAKIYPYCRDEKFVGRVAIYSLDHLYDLFFIALLSSSSYPGHFNLCLSACMTSSFGVQVAWCVCAISTQVLVSYVQ